MTLPEKIKKLRKDRGWSQGELSKRLNVHAGHISRLETARYQPSLELLRKLSAVFEVTADYLLNDSENEFSAVAIEDKSLAEKVRLIDKMEPKERSALLTIIDGLLTKKKVVDLLTREKEIAI